MSYLSFDKSNINYLLDFMIVSKIALGQKHSFGENSFIWNKIEVVVYARLSTYANILYIKLQKKKNIKNRLLQFFYKPTQWRTLLTQIK